MASTATPARRVPAGTIAALRRALPHGQTLPEAAFRTRHRFLLGLLWLHVPLLFAWALIQGYGFFHALAEGGIVAVLAAAATVVGPDRRLAPPLVAVGLLTASAVLVHISGGYIEAHFHFFVIVVLLALYEDWVPFLIAAAYVVLHHGIAGAIDPEAVYNHPDAVQHPWQWAGIHAAFILFAGLGALALWRLNEDVRRDKEQAVERALAAEHLQEAYAKDLERSNKELEQFAYAASHDLSEPLRTISSFLTLLERRHGERLDADAHQFIAYAVQGADRMQQLIDDLLEFSRAGRAELAHEVVDLRAVLAATTDALRAALEERGGEVEAGALPRVAGDRRQLNQVFQNLLTNAIKFTDGAPPRVRVEASREGGWATVSVADNGIGIAPVHAERVFQMFSRLHTREEYEGTGIGLALVARIVERHGGRIWVEPNAGGGSVFRFTLPVAD